MKKGIIYNLNPFNNETNMSSAEYIIKKLLAFILIYVFSAVLGEGIIIGILYGMGYDPLHGIMPAGEISELLLYYGCGLHSAWNFILYVIMGLSLSGSESVSKGVVLFGVKDASILNGAEYGIEASVITTVVLGMLLFVMVKGWKGRIGKDGIS